MQHTSGKNPRDGQSYHRSFFVAASAEQVWEAITLPQHAAHWICDTLDLELREGGVFRTGGPHCITPIPEDGQVLRCEPERILELVWPIHGRATRLLLELVAEGAGTRLRVTHAPMDRWPEGLEVPALWALQLTNLRHLIERPAESERAMDAPHRVDFSQPYAPMVWLGLTIETLPVGVFQHLTDSALLRRWLGTAARVQPQEGGKLTFGWGARGPSRVEALKKNRLVVHDWQDPALSGPTRVTWSIMPEKGASRVEFLHEGFVESDDVGRYRLLWSAAMVLLKEDIERDRSFGLGWWTLEATSAS